MKSVLLPTITRSSWYRQYRHFRRVLLNIWHAQQAKRHYNYPARGMRLIGVTGTDGKTTTATMLASILQASGRKAGLISTVEAKIDDQSIDTGLHVSTPGPTQIYKLLAKMRDEGVDDVVIEATSHGLDQRRLHGLSFEIGIITNVAAEHLDYHLTIESYAQAKARLLDQSAMAVLNADDAIVSQLNTRQLPQLLFGIDSTADVTAHKIKEVAGKSEFAVHLPDRRELLPITLTFPGQFNIRNALAAIAASHILGVAPPSMQAGLKSVSVAGRWQVVQDAPFTVIVDFAHTPQAFAATLPEAKKLVKKGGQLYQVFGSAAERDEVKRIEMGYLSAKYADMSVLTMDDPRHEPLDRIQGMLIEGIQQTGKQEQVDWVRIDDRQEAIDWAIAQAKPGDVVLLSGKGHEPNMTIKGQELPWSDVAAAQSALKRKKP